MGIEPSDYPELILTALMLPLHFSSKEDNEKKREHKVNSTINPAADLLSKSTSNLDRPLAGTEVECLNSCHGQVCSDFIRVKRKTFWIIQ